VIFLCRALADLSNAAVPDEPSDPVVGNALVLPSQVQADDWQFNDHCMLLAREGGVRLVAYQPAQRGLRFVEVDNAMQALEPSRATPLVGAPPDPILNTASARRLGTSLDEPVLVLAPTELLYNQTSDLRLVNVDPDYLAWAERLRISDGDEYQLQLGTEVQLGGGFMLVTFKRLHRDWRSTADDNDSGDIVRILFRANKQIRRETLVDAVGSGFERCGNRPHSIKYETGGKTYVITTWDEWDVSISRGKADVVALGCTLRVDEWVR
jgi:hypothetical protein